MRKVRTRRSEITTDVVRSAPNPVFRIVKNRPSPTSSSQNSTGPSSPVRSHSIAHETAIRWIISTICTLQFVRGPVRVSLKPGVSILEQSLIGAGAPGARFPRHRPPPGTVPNSLGWAWSANGPSSAGGPSSGKNPGSTAAANGRPPAKRGEKTRPCIKNPRRMAPDPGPFGTQPAHWPTNPPAHGTPKSRPWHPPSGPRGPTKKRDGAEPKKTFDPKASSG